MPTVMILGVTGMLGHVLFRELTACASYDVRGTARSIEALRGAIPPAPLGNVTTDIDAADFASVRRLLDQVRPDVVINAIGIIKQDPRIRNLATTVAVNALFPHHLAEHCTDIGARLIHVSTDCVFSGQDGKYTESDQPDAHDFYGLSKLLGEVASPALVLRTSIIGHELTGHRSLIDWFLSSSGTVHGFTRAIYSGVTTVEFARLIASVIIPRPQLAGLMHVAAAPISKHDLLTLVAKQYNWSGVIIPQDSFACDRSLIAERLQAATGYQPPDWPTMIRAMYESSPYSLSGTTTLASA
jgi:dTDP-4-dehydrorhamnose reductase